MPRLFTGVEIPFNIGQALAMLRGGLPGARWIMPDNYHLTLRFIGDVLLRAGAAHARRHAGAGTERGGHCGKARAHADSGSVGRYRSKRPHNARSEEHTSELQSLR